MRIGIDAYLLHAGSDYRAAGVSRYSHELLSLLPQVAPQHEYVAFAGRDAPRVNRIQMVVAPVPTERPPVRIVWEQIGLPVEAALRNVDVLHGLVNVVPLAGVAPAVVTVHDLAFLRHPERFPPAKAAYLRVAVGASVRRARRMIAVSENTKHDLVELMDVPEEMVDVVYPGVDPRFGVIESEPPSLPGLRGRPYVLYVGTLEPRKNLDLLIGAFVRARGEEGLPHALVLAGAPGWMYESLFELTRDLKAEQDVLFAGYVGPADLPRWYNSADLFAYPSAYEGFGFPLLEAMSCGVPAVTTASSALAEVAGDACMTVEPGSEEALCAALRQLLGDPDLRASLRTRGLERAAGFTWERTARETAEVYERVRAMAS